LITAKPWVAKSRSCDFFTIQSQEKHLGVKGFIVLNRVAKTLKPSFFFLRIHMTPIILKSFIDCPVDNFKIRNFFIGTQVDSLKSFRFWRFSFQIDIHEPGVANSVKP